MFDVFFQRDAFHILHDDVLEFIAQRDIVDFDDVRMGQDGNGFGFVFEPSAEFLVGEELIFQDFDGDHTVVDIVVGLVDHGHTADADDLPDLVTAVEPFSHIIIHSLSPPQRRR